jgi:hypothetical protein
MITPGISTKFIKGYIDVVAVCLKREDGKKETQKKSKGPILTQPLVCLPE